MEETVVVEQTPQQIEEQAAVERYRDSQKPVDERNNEIPEGYNADGTPTESAPILGKFKSQEDLVKAYQELEKKLGQPKEETPKAPEPTVEPTTTTDFSIAKYNQELSEKGSLSDASYKELEAKGFDRASVDAYIKGQQALVTQFTQTVYDTVGGQENYTKLTTWAASNLPQEIINEYNQELAKGNTAKVTQLLEYMSFKAGSSVPQQPRRLEGQATVDTGGIKPFANKLEWQQATSNRLYGKDAKYTNLMDKRYLEAKKKGLI